MKNKFYLLFYGLKKYPWNKRTHRGGNNTAIFAEWEKSRTNVANEVVRRKAMEHNV